MSIPEVVALQQKGRWSPGAPATQGWSFAGAAVRANVSQTGATGRLRAPSHCGCNADLRSDLSATQ